MLKFLTSEWKRSEYKNNGKIKRENIGSFMHLQVWNTIKNIMWITVFICCFSVAQPCLTFCDLLDYSMPGFPILHHLVEFAQTLFSQWCYPTISSSVAPFSSCPQSFPASDFIFLGSKITVDSHKIKRRLLLGRKIMIKLDSILKSREITLPTEVCVVKAMVFPVVIYR